MRAQELIIKYEAKITPPTKMAERRHKHNLAH